MDALVAKPVFVIYRSVDKHFAHLIYNRLASQMPEQVAMDSKALPSGTDWDNSLMHFLEHCRVCVLVIGERWLTGAQQGQSAIDNPNDFHRREIERALARWKAQAIQMHVVREPSAPQLSTAELPAAIEKLKTIHSVEIRVEQLESDLEPVIERIKGFLHEGNAGIRRLKQYPASDPATVTKDAAKGPRSTTVQPIDSPSFVPEVVPIGPGRFDFGSDPIGDPASFPDEEPRQPAEIKHAFEIGKYPVTFEQWDAFVHQSGYPHQAQDFHWGRRTKPVIGVSWHDAKAYVHWLSRTTGQSFRLPTELEWEFAARGGTQTPYYWGERYDLRYAHCDSRIGTIDVGQKGVNPYGLFDMAGNVWEWVEDDWQDRSESFRSRVRRWADKVGSSKRVVRGGAWNSEPALVRCAARHGVDPGLKDRSLGFRVALTLK